MTDCVILDLDGTLCDLTHRLHHVRNGRKDWDAFFAGIGDDLLIRPVARLAEMARESGYPIILSTGRPEKCRQGTEEWLRRHCVHHDHLYMRPDDDTRPDHVVKRQILDGIRADGYEPVFVVDDRISVVQMWREAGLCCLQAKADDSEAGTALLTIMVGPSGAGKTTWVNANRPFSQVVSSDDVRRDLLGDFRDQTRNDDVFQALHQVVTARLRAGLPTTIDATNIRRKDRIACVELASGGPVQYIVINRPMPDKYRDAGWRGELGFDLIAKHDQTFKSQVKDILSGDGFLNVEVVNSVRS